jgi:hypothetical protein
MTRLADRTPLVLAALLFLGTGWTFVVKSGFVTADDPNQMLTASGHMAGGSPDPHLIYSNYLWGVLLTTLFELWPGVNWYTLCLFEAGEDGVQVPVTVDVAQPDLAGPSGAGGHNRAGEPTDPVTQTHLPLREHPSRNPSPSNSPRATSSLRPASADMYQQLNPPRSARHTRCGFPGPPKFWAMTTSTIPSPLTSPAAVLAEAEVGREI